MAMDDEGVEAKDPDSKKQAPTSIAEHLRSCYCLPFPAGPVIPRRITKLPSPGVRCDPSPKERSSSATDDIAERWGLKRNGRAAGCAGNNPLLRLLGDGLAEWVTRHDLTKFADKPRTDTGYPPLGDLLNSLEVAGGVVKPVVMLGSEFAGRLERAHQARARYYRSLTRQEQPSHLDLLAYAAPAYDCECGNAKSLTSIPHADVRPLYHAGAEKVCKETMGGDWLLLLAFFLKQVHSHLAFPAKHGRHEKSQAALYLPLRRIVSSFAISEGALSSVAAGLCTVKLQPHWHDGEGGAHLPKGLPSCFVPVRLEPPATALEHCRAHFSGISGGNAVVDQMVIDAHSLAREAASLLTDSPVAPQLGLTFKTLAGHCEEQQRELKTLSAEGRLPTDAAPTWFVCDVEYDHWLIVAAQTKRLQSYFAWMTTAKPDAESAVKAPPVLVESGPGKPAGTASGA